jgi:uncharacterized protein YjbJ (UPF0337 family)
MRAQHTEKVTTNKDRIEGPLKQAKGSAEEAAGKLLADAELTTKGKANRVAGKVQNTVGSPNEAVTKAVDRK